MTLPSKTSSLKWLMLISQTSTQMTPITWYTDEGGVA